ncbi:MAG: protoheme IX farnesyltransferase [Nitriliruptorales bacterium]|nr:protoheme IX farnesyltransferase [Nitriliruptorales bacterium]
MARCAPDRNRPRQPRQRPVIRHGHSAPGRRQLDLGRSVPDDGAGVSRPFRDGFRACRVPSTRPAAAGGGTVTPVAAARRPAPGVVRAYVALTKPRIIELLLVTTVPTMVIAQRGVPPLGLVIATLVGGSLAAGSANAINNYFDRDIDELMARTSHRPLPRHAVTPTAALRFGVTLGVLSFVWLVALVNLLSAVLAAGAILFYVFVYTLGLKRRSPQNIVIGGAAGCVPVLVGWAAVTGQVGLPALLLFAIVFAWTPPHFWALALKYREDYGRAGVPMLPVVRGVAETGRQILLYSILLVCVTLMFGPVGQMGLLYLVAAVGLGGTFIFMAWQLLRDTSEQMAMRLFRFSITYLGLLFTAMAVDAAISGPLL